MEIILGISLLVNAFLILYKFDTPKIINDGLTLIGLKVKAETELKEYDRLVLIAKELNDTNWLKVDFLQSKELIQLVVRKHIKLLLNKQKERVFELNSMDITKNRITWEANKKVIEVKKNEIEKYKKILYDINSNRPRK